MIAILTAVVAIVLLGLMSFILLKRLDKKGNANRQAEEVDSSEEGVEEEINTNPENLMSGPIDINNTRQTVSTTIDRNT
jgi:hypothetical protein